MKEIFKDTTGVILVGGKSRRMGKDKAFLKVEGITFFEKILKVFKENFIQVLLAGDKEERFADYNLQHFPDIYPGSSLGGLYTGLYNAKTEYVFVSSCDLPFPNEDVLRYLYSLKTGFDAVVPCSIYGYEPLFALYSKSCLEPIRGQLVRGEYCAYAYYPEIRVRSVSSDELSELNPDGSAFMNINTPEDFAKIGVRL